MLALGIDLGTSGVRCCVRDAEGRIVAQSRQPGAAVEIPQPGWVQQDPETWWKLLKTCITNLPAALRQSITRISVDGTSATLLLADDNGRPLTAALMYNDRRATSEARRIASVAPADCAAHGPSSSLAKLLWLRDHVDSQPAHALHQADWINGQLCGRWDVSDYNNALKLGYDTVRLRWPDWLRKFPGVMPLLPTVVAPGADIGTIRPELARSLGFSADTIVTAGTTDSTAAFIATGASEIGDAVTSIGSTLVMKITTPTPIFSPEYGIYSHRIGNQWLAGGASNSGGAVLLRYFTPAQLADLSNHIDPAKDSGLDFYPLVTPGERFPINDPQLPPRIAPADQYPPERFLHGLLEGIARIELLAYQRLHELGAPWPKQVLTAGGGAQNSTWLRMRERILSCPVSAAKTGESACGAAQLAQVFALSQQSQRR